MTATSPNFVLLDSARPDIAKLMIAMLQARDAALHANRAQRRDPAFRYGTQAQKFYGRKRLGKMKPRASGRGFKVMRMCPEEETSL